LFGFIVSTPLMLIGAVVVVVILLFSRRIRKELVELRLRKNGDKDRFGFGSPLKETPRSNEHPGSSEAEG